MRKILGIVALAGVGLVLFLFVGLLALVHLIQVGEFRRFLIQEVESRTQLRIEAGEADLQVGKVIGFSVRDFALYGEGATVPVIAAERVLVNVALLPLLDRRVVFDEIRFLGPQIRIGSHPGDGIPFLDLLVTLPRRKGEDVPFTFDVDRVTVEKGEISFTDHRKGPGPTGIALSKVNINIRRIPGPGVSRSDTPALEYGLEAVVKEGKRQAHLTSRGKVFLPKEGDQLRAARWDVRVDMDALPVGLLEDYYGMVVPWVGRRGVLVPRLRWRGSLAGGGRITGAVGFRQLGVNLPGTMPGAVALADGGMEVDVEASPREIRFRRVDLHSGEVNLSARGSLRSPSGKDPYLEAHLTTPFLPLAALRKYVSSVMPESSPWGTLVRAVDRGEVRFNKAGVAGRLSELSHLFDPGFEEHLWFDAEVRGGGGKLPGDLDLPFHGVSGRIILERGVLAYRDFKGSYGQSSFQEISGTQRGILSGERSVEVHARGTAVLGELWERWRHGLLPRGARKIANRIQGLEGKGSFQFTFRSDLRSSRYFEGQLSLEDASLRVGGRLFSRVSGDLSFSPREIHAEKISALMAGSPLRLRLSLTDYLSQGSSFDLSVKSPGIKAAEVARLLPFSGAEGSAGTIRGELRYLGSLASNGERTLTGSLELVGVQIPLVFLRRPLHEVSGELELDRSGITLRGFRGRVGGHEFTLNGAWRYGGRPQLTFELSSPEMDLGAILPLKDTELHDWYDRLQAKGKIRIAKGRYEGFTFSDLRTDLSLDQRQWLLENFSSRSLGGTLQGRGRLFDNPGGVSFSLQPDVRGVPIRGVLRWFEGETKEITGRVNLSGTFESSGQTADERKRNLNGAFQVRVEDGIVRRFRLLARILSLLDLARWFSLKMPDIRQDGIRFHRLSADVKITHGVYSTQNLLLDSDDLRITGAGQLDAAKGRVDFVIAVRPFPKVDSAVSYIPLLGRGLAGIKNSLLVASFRVKGPIENPSITPSPLNTLSEFFYGALAIPKDLIGLQGKEKK